MLRSQFEEQLKELHQQLLTMGIMVEEAVHKSVKSLVQKDIPLAEAVIEGDKLINDAEVNIEKSCFSLIALQQPVGSDLRRIAMTLKVATDLERMADHAVSIAKATIHLKDETYAKPLVDIPLMAELAQKMLRDTLDAYIEMNKDEAIAISKRDDEVDAYFKKIFLDLIDLMKSDRASISQSSHLLLVAQYLERIGDYTTNICEWIVYMAAGKMIELNN
ncbi:phosphate signaling complex protein PhoU [Siminovitchia sp. FSL H7-0308]|uniref:Phosphate-specific transport system accessory protein PhoU n=1 Tax=Siminovitchia thermophila TaxID=1245522 RepID=A0ABS2R2I6_9BACI|nr:phosphate signaling complex protein PhoU [Siminovitchia thermophila]MBM7713847.1 phosphate transport system protein [Siminovitchia thermophila]ONK22517.1 phosphate transport system regulatory protein PhoU [Bacillus sp. VT-16-64]